MLRGLFGSDTTTYMLRGALEETSATHREISSRVANASTASTQGGFADQLAAAQGANEEIDLQTDHALKEIWQQAAILSTDLASRILGRSLVGEDHERLVRELMTEIHQEAGVRSGNGEAESS